MISSTSETILSIKDLHASVEDQEILHGVNLLVKEGEIHAIMGRNGSGKSTLQKLLLVIHLTKFYRDLSNLKVRIFLS